MRPFLAIVCLSLFLLGCASNVTYSKNELQDLFSLNESPRAWSPNLNEIESHFTINSTKHAEKVIYDFYCNQGNQIRALKTQVQVIISQPSLNIPLDQAAKIQQEKREIVQDYLMNFYKILFFEDQLIRSGMHVEITRSNFFAFNQNNLDSINPSLIDNKIDKSLKLIFGLPHFEVQYDRKKFLIPKYFLVGTENSHRSFVGTNAQVIQAFPSDKSEETMTYQTTTDLYLVEKILAKKFTIMKYYDTQKSISELIRPIELKKIWAAYLDEFTRYKEAQSTDPQIINYEVELDLKEFCKYGRPINDLLSK